MSEDSPMYKKYAPENNSQISDLIREKVERGEFPPIVILNTLDVMVLTYYVPGLIEGLEVGEEHYMGFKAAIKLAIAAMWNAVGNDLNSKLTLYQSGTPEIRNNGSAYISRGEQIFLQDKTGKKLLSDVIVYIQDHFSNLDFIEGARTALTVYLAYFKKFS